MKRGAVLAMLVLTALGFWLVYQPNRATVSEGAVRLPVVIAGERGLVEYLPDADDGRGAMRILYRDGTAGRWLDPDSFREIFGPEVARTLSAGGTNALFRLFNVTSWGSVLWVLLGFAAQSLFAGRMLLQWIVSEKARASVVPTAFWWLSLVGGACLFAYFVWRKDVVGVFGQSTGIVIYARNLRLIHKQKLRSQPAPSPA